MLLDSFTDEWPISGGALDFELQPRLYDAFSRGLAKAAKATNAWVITGGTNVRLPSSHALLQAARLPSRSRDTPSPRIASIQTGVMKLVGRALEHYDAVGNLVGILPWNVIHDKELLVRKGVEETGNANQGDENSYGPVIELPQDKRNDENAANLEPHHTHFIMVDNGISDKPQSVKFTMTLKQ